MSEDLDWLLSEFLLNRAAVFQEWYGAGDTQEAYEADEVRAKAIIEKLKEDYV
jgi:hypothetical protein